MANIISLVNNKGGVGKTTIAVLLAAALAKLGYSVLVADLDPQGSACKWRNQAVDEDSFPVRIVDLSQFTTSAHRELRTWAQSFDIVIADCPGSKGADIAELAVMVSNLVVIPTRQSLLDVLEVQHTIDTVATVGARFDRTIPSCIVLNQLQENTRLAKEAVGLLSSLNSPLLESKLHLRQAYMQSMVNGGTAESVPDGQKAVEEVSALAAEVLQVLSKSSASAALA